mmetsp:Transcript_4934/g.7483  ORF Transcript_4934/g.7483 Transcript_4934/m.7483 type:complete len:396 (+) Transcript_4934:27-1214(+)
MDRNRETLRLLYFYPVKPFRSAEWIDVRNLLAINGTNTTIGENPLDDPNVMHRNPYDPPWLNDCQRLCNNDSSLKKLVYRYQYLGDVGAAAVGAALSVNTKLKKLILKNNGIGDDGMEALVQGLRENTSIEELQMTRIRLSNALGKVLEVNKTIKTLYVSYSRIGKAEVASIAKGLKSNNSLESLNLYENQIGDDAVADLMEAIKTCKTLKRLFLGANRISNEGATKISATLMSCSSLKYIDLSNNQIGDEGAIAFAKVLATDNSLESLILLMNKIGDQGAGALASALEENVSLERINLAGNNLTLDGIEKLRNVLWRQNKTLKFLMVDNKNDALFREIAFYTALNRVGRRFSDIEDVSLPHQLWPSFLAKASKNANILFWVVREKPDLFQEIQH